MKVVAAVALLCLTALGQAQSLQWSEKRANDWYRGQPWLVGANYAPASAINQLEMWQEGTWNPKEIDRELGWAQAIGMNTMRVFLHDLLWQQDQAGMIARMRTFLNLCQKHKIRPMFVLFDSVWDPAPALGKQREPKPGVHNSGWVQGPGKALADASQHARLEEYVKGVVGAFARDKRVLAWDIWNEPDNLNGNSYGNQEIPKKVELVVEMLSKAFNWARSANPTQPLTSGVWQGDWSSPEKLSATEKVQLEQSDVISFHNYEGPESFKQRLQWLERYKRPLLCTEYMARGNNSTFAGILPVAASEKVAAINWGLVKGKTQTHLPWDSWQKPYVDREPTVWHHEVFHPDGTPYSEEEVNTIRKMTRGDKVKKAA